MAMAASEASAAFMVPWISPSSLPSSPPNWLKITLLTGRFMALAIISVSRVPAEPTTVPAMIIAGFCSTKPSKATARPRSEEHTSELQSRPHLVCRLLLEKKKKKRNKQTTNKKKRKQQKYTTALDD